ncbi:hypothetical protein IRZ71_11525 [Flavobacterium sp. ANB]|uniref:hypothetical protein n=1 Tax=unclassified Flavobacterium TaxID=196869 RepID=UPI0012BA1E5A|nr:MULTISPECIES: hypothetical protein [unclassified Flavobacterium]MBF4516981.1 hypothetical protein [Flavobacterium sp. ANB]MTD69123.1 hypothetical protein [Flavobacterium sp. LC2016-13]
MNRIVAIVRETIFKRFKKSKLPADYNTQTVEEFISDDPNHNQNKDVDPAENLEGKNEQK